jgi:hypothetical protein
MEQTLQLPVYPFKPETFTVMAPLWHCSMSKDFVMNKLIKMLSLAFCIFTINFGQQAAIGQTTAETARGNCKACVETCQKTLNYCTTKGGKYAEATITNALKDCITSCKGTDDLLNRGSAYLQAKSCTMTIDAANNCAKACDKFNTDNQMLACANECRKCVGNCSKISSGAANAK